ncbi:MULTISPECIES: ABC transporter substrate-binding protein [unclassified Sphingomonas]|uniref:ABC transporter substrate-binding protein n=1 Tax=unclassified Sphingomonas TaxID=196159 RepID=UPI00138F4421|nr:MULTISPECIES: ABC transporter substrate-binding protein [unclassified Sphingomonas]
MTENDFGQRGLVMSHLIGKFILAIALAVVPAAILAEPLRVVGNTQVFESGALALAAETSPKGTVEFSLGGVPNLWDTGLPALTAVVTAGGPVAPTSHDRLADLAANAETQFLRATVAHPDGRYLFTVVEGIYRIVGRKSKGIAHETDLKGKRIATYPGTSAAFYLRKVLERSGLTEKDVTIVQLPPKACAEALIAGTVDAMSMWEPHAEDAIRTIGADVITFQPADGYREIYSLYATAATLNNPTKRAQIVAYVREMILACKQGTTNPGRIQALLSVNTGRSKEDIAAAWNYNLLCATSPNILDVMVEEEIWLAAQDGREPRTRQQIATLIDSSVLDEAKRLK